MIIVINTCCFIGDAKGRKRQYHSGDGGIKKKAM